MSRCIIYSILNIKMILRGVGLVFGKGSCFLIFIYLVKINFIFVRRCTRYWGYKLGGVFVVGRYGIEVERRVWNS